MSAERSAEERTERAVLGCVLLDRDAIAAVVDTIPAGAFATPICRATYDIMAALWKERIPPDPIIVADRLASDGWDVADMLSMSLDVTTAVHLPFYLDALRGHASRRRIVVASQELANCAVTSSDPFSVLKSFSDDYSALQGHSRRHGPVSYEELIPSFRESLIDEWEGRVPRVERATGWPDLDGLLNGGLFPGDLAIIAARPGIGKTALVLQIAHNMARRYPDESPVFFSAEMTTRSLLIRALAEVTGYSYGVITASNIPKFQREHLLEATERLEQMGVRIDDQSGITTDMMRSRIERLQRDQPVSAVFFDYLELAGDTVGRTENEERRVASIVRSLKAIARDCQVPMVALSQLNREVERRAGCRPHLADLRQSGVIEQTADSVILMFRYDYYAKRGLVEEDPGKKGLVELTVAKNRNGREGNVALIFDESSMSFRPFPRP